MAGLILISIIALVYFLCMFANAKCEENFRVFMRGIKLECSCGWLGREDDLSEAGTCPECGWATDLEEPKELVK